MICGHECDVLKVLKIARAIGECNLRTFETSRVTINHEMHEQVHTNFYLLYSQQNYSNMLLCARYILLKTLQWFPICSHVLFEPIRNIMFFAFSLSCSMMFWFDKANLLSAIFFHFGVQIWHFTGVSIATSVLHSTTWIALYNLFMHSPLANQKQDILLSV